jgi:hypothetical protein
VLLELKVLSAGKASGKNDLSKDFLAAVMKGFLRGEGFDCGRFIGIYLAELSRV